MSAQVDAAHTDDGGCEPDGYILEYRAEGNLLLDRGVRRAGARHRVHCTPAQDRHGLRVPRRRQEQGWRRQVLERDEGGQGELTDW